MNATLDEKAEVVATKTQFYPTFFLGLFLGVFGVHRFYTGKIKSGVVQLLTFGGLGIWWLIDMVMILIGKFKDKNGVAMPNVSPKMTWGIFIVAVIIGMASGGGGANPESKTSGGSSHTPSSSVSTSDIVGHWSNDSDMTDFTLNSSGSCSYSFAGHDPSRGSWRLSGSTVVVNLGDGGESVSFVYRNGKLVAPNGHYLTR
jgi:TM2 domain-containing membrane protein YozV